MGAFESIVQTMMDMNVFHLFFPWLLLLAVTYGLLEKYEFFDESVNGTISLAFATMAMGGIFLFVPEGLFSHFAAVMAFGAFGILGLLILMAIAGIDIGEFEDPQGELPGIVALVVFILGFLGVVVAQLDIGSLLGGVRNTFQEVVMPILILVFLLLVVSTTTGGGE